MSAVEIIITAESKSLEQGSEIIMFRTAELLGPKGEKLLVGPLTAGTCLHVVHDQVSYCATSTQSAIRPGVVVFDEVKNVMGIIPADICQIID